ncbi:hypothetical protein [Dyadobacter sp. MSC1_007]|jgi:hypothetical protein|uniref:hypothetical protein n=1 Tax=Dyadobacter sp. MSC1_007 TaxID=2909264 RepID=UPI00202F8138|nr:hypothetical protein [Dyadobacter sp. MSC1_007]
MRTSIPKILYCLFMLGTLNASVALPQPPETVNGNPLLLNGAVVTMEQLAWAARGVLAVVKRDAASTQSTRVPFYIYLKRDGKIVDANAYAHNHSVMQYELAEVLRSARAGDQIVIDPVVKSDAVGRSIITVKTTQLVPHFDWSYGLKQKKDGC